MNDTIIQDCTVHGTGINEHTGAAIIALAKVLEKQAEAVVTLAKGIGGGSCGIAIGINPFTPPTE